LITSAYSIVCRQTGTDRILGAVTVTAVTKSGADGIAVLIMADRFDLPPSDVEVIKSTVELAGLVGNLGEDYRERHTLEKLACRAAMRFKRMGRKELAMVMPAVLRAVCPGMPLVVLRNTDDFAVKTTTPLYADQPDGPTITFRKNLKGQFLKKQGQIITSRNARSGVV